MKPKKIEERDLTKLPQWVQERIAQLAMKVNELQATLQADRSGHPDSPVQVDPSGDHVSYGLEPRATVRFRIGDEKYGDGRYRYWIEVSLRDGRLQVMGNQSLLAYPSSSNVLYVDIEDRFELDADRDIRDLGQRLVKELVAKGLDWQDGLNLIYDCNPTAVKNGRNRRREV